MSARVLRRAQRGDEVAEDACPCGRGRPLDACCGRLHDGTTRALRAEDVMRARYSAYALGVVPYLLTTWHPTTRPTGLELPAATRWLGLTVQSTTGGGPLDDTGTVEFTATYADGDAPPRAMHEVSRFARLDGEWLYVSA